MLTRPCDSHLARTGDADGSVPARPLEIRSRALAVFACSARTTLTRASTPRTFNFEQELANDLSLYFDFTHSKGVHLTRFLNLRAGLGFLLPNLGETCSSTTALGKSLYNGFTVGMRKRFSKGYQFEWNYTLAKDKDDDSNERDPFTDRSFDLFNLQLDYALSDRDIRHKFQLLHFRRIAGGFEGNFRVQARSAQPIIAGVRHWRPTAKHATKNNAVFLV